MQMSVILLCCWQALQAAVASPTSRDDVRLVGGAEAYEGTVQVKTDEGWMNICDDSFDFDVADVVCRQLGYEGAARYTDNNDFGSPALPWYGEIQCTGLESSLQQCSRSRAIGDACLPKEAAGVVCRAGVWTNCAVGQFQCGAYNLHTCIDRDRICDGIRHCFDNSDENPQMCGDFGVAEVGSGSTNGTGVAGPLRIKHEGQWSTVCDDNMQHAEAKVICRSLGYETAVLYPNAYLGEGTGIIRSLNASCSGEERWLSECPEIEWDTQIACDHTEDVGLICSNKMEVRLAGGSSHEGRVEMFLAGQWGTVCDRDFDHYDAKVVCRMLGFHGDADVIAEASRFGDGEGPVWLDMLDCNGTETHLELCISALNISFPKCGHERDAAVSCSHAKKPNVDNDLATKLLPTSVVCGRPADASAVFITSLAKVVRGRPQERLDAPWLAAIYVVIRSDEKPVFICGATVISEWFLLSAAHCFRNTGHLSIIVKVGDFQMDVKDRGEQTYRLEKLIRHHEADVPFRTNNDIALLKVAAVGGRGISFSPTVQPLCLPPEDTDYATLRNCTAVGWGHTIPTLSRPSTSVNSNTPRMAKLQVFRKEQCTGPRQLFSIQLRSDNICAGDLLGGESICFGDSGGPMSCLGKGGRPYLYGISSSVNGCGIHGRPGVYVKVAKFLRWIQNKIASL